MDLSEKVKWECCKSAGPCRCGYRELNPRYIPPHVRRELSDEIIKGPHHENDDGAVHNE